MKCIVCKQISFKIICKNCQQTFLKPSKTARELPCGFKIYSFYHYDEIADFLKTKHTHIGASVYKILAENAFRKFAQEFKFSSTIYALPIDDHSNSGYSHTAILAKELRAKNIKPKYSKLRAQNKVSYSGKSLEYRLKNPRKFYYNFKSNIDVILIDDIVTSSTTLNEAKNRLLKEDVNPLFALTLADARDP